MPELNKKADTEFLELVRLQRRFEVVQYLLRDEKLSQSDRTLLRWMAGVLIRAETKEEALKGWKGLIHRRGRLEGDFTETQLQELSIPDDHIVRLFSSVKNICLGIAEELPKTVDQLVNGQYGHRWNDGYEARQTPKRSLEILRQNGITIKLQPNSAMLLQTAYNSDKHCPLLDVVKNFKLVTINGFVNSKTSLTVHDLFDHFWLYAKLEEEGILGRYSDILQKVGNPHLTDIFSREGELIASVGFDYRSFKVSESTFKPMFTFDNIKKVLLRSKKSGKHTANQEKALHILNNLDPSSEEAKCVCYVISGMTIELLEQRRKNGFIRELDKEYEDVGVFGILDTEYIALSIEAHHFLFSPRSNADTILLNISAIVEDFLLSYVTGSGVDECAIKLDTITQFNPEESKVTRDKIEWMKKKIGFTANRRDLCNE